MNETYLYEQSNLLGTLLSAAVFYQRSFADVERKIAYSSYFQTLEHKYAQIPLLSQQSLLSEIFHFSELTNSEAKTYRNCLWASESYLRIQVETNLTFEAIFLICPIEKMLGYFPLYHEMGFDQIVMEFKRLFSQNSILSILMNKFRYSAHDISRVTNLPIITIQMLKNRKRSIKKANVETVSKLAHLFHVRLETIAELTIE